jgi:hypothetical protein
MSTRSPFPASVTLTATAESAPRGGSRISASPVVGFKITRTAPAAESCTTDTEVAERDAANCRMMSPAGAAPIEIGAVLSRGTIPARVLGTGPAQPCWTTWTSSCAKSLRPSSASGRNWPAPNTTSRPLVNALAFNRAAMPAASGSVWILTASKLLPNRGSKTSRSLMGSG